MNKILTVKEFLKDNNLKEIFNSGPPNLETIFIEFAKMHCKAQVEAICEKAKVLMIDSCSDHTPYRGECGNCGSYHTYKMPSDEINKDSILTAYLLENIV
jgi:hypothetical protein